MSERLRSILPWPCILVVCLGLLLGASGCQTLRMPWSSNAGLPPQSEPRLK